MFLQRVAICRWNAVVIPAKSVAANNIEFPHAMHPQHHVPLPTSVISLRILKFNLRLSINEALATRVELSALDDICCIYLYLAGSW